MSPGIHPDDPDLQVYIGAADDIINSILTLPLDLPGFKFHKVCICVFNEF